MSLLADFNVPSTLNIATNFDSVIPKGRFPTYSFLFIVTPQIEKRFTNGANSPYCAISVLVRRIGADGLRDKPSSNSYLSFAQQIPAACRQEIRSRPVMTAPEITTATVTVVCFGLSTEISVASRRCSST